MSKMDQLFGPLKTDDAMNWKSLFSLIPTLFLSYLFLTYIYNITFHPLARFPGPKTWAMSGIPFAVSLVRGHIVFRIADLHKEYNSRVIRTGPNRLSFTDAAAFKTIYSYKGTVMKKDPGFYYMSQMEQTHLVDSLDDEIHGRQRRNVSHAFSAKALEGQQGLLNSYVDLLVRRLKERDGNVSDMEAWYNFTTFDIIGDLAFGEPFGSLESGEYHPWIRTIISFVPAIALNQALRCFPHVFPILMACVPASVKKSADDHIAFGAERAARRIDQGVHGTSSDRKDFWTYILQNNDKKYGLTYQEMQANASLFVLAGSETTAQLLSGATYYLLKSPAKAERLTRELRSRFEREEDIDFRSVSDVKYLVACLEEALRIYPPVPIGLPRLVPQGGAEVGGMYVPGGTSVSATHYGTFRSKDYFQDAESFVPERWLGEDKRYDNDNRGVVLPFSIGPRNCIGQHLAIVEMRLIIGRLLWNFDLELDPESERWIDHKAYLLWEKNPLMVKLTKRKS